MPPSDQTDPPHTAVYVGEAPAAQQAPASGPPPTYLEAIDPNAPPPTYDSLFGRVQEIQKSSSGLFDFVKNLTLILVGTIGCSIVITITIVIPISMIVMGSLYLEACPVAVNIPIYLIVGGVFGLLKQLLYIRTDFRRTSAGGAQAQASDCTKSLQRMISFFLSCWFVAGCFWVYRVFRPDADEDSPFYCDPTLYSYAFWLLTSLYIFLGAATLCLCCVSGTAFLITK